MKKSTRTVLATLASITILAVATIIAVTNLGGAAAGPGSGSGGGGPSDPTVSEGADASASPRDEEPADRGVPAAAPVAVETIEARTGSLERAVRLGGEVRARDSVVAFPDTGGTVSRILVEVGSAVVAGQPLAFVDPSRPGNRFEPSPVDSPITGTVVDLPVELGQTVATSSQIATVATLDALEIEIDVPERYSPALRRGSTVTVSTLAAPDRPIAARIDRVDPVINAATRSKSATLTPVGGTTRLEVGMYVQVEFVVSSVADTVFLPVDAVVRQGQAAWAFVVSADGIVSERALTLGLIEDDRVQIIAGISAGERVVRYGVGQVRDRQAVRVVNLAGEASR